MTARPNVRRANGSRRTALRKRVLARDTHCWLCKEPVDQTLPPTLPLSPEVHEIIPVSRGGSPYEVSNCTLTHRACNQWIGNRTPDELARDSRPKPSAIRTGFDW
ncbi:HNH endonuclease signature motif containing protein [Curtobacterium sp. MCLR17_036]|uniref:HNH endonuclease n=1 Tax=Curtobacterium sp. MCLR17_036 TaxID=2175620 RepID=UPI000DA902A4|nr:HNH endonuclease signature motif containing protein [Curtobacterium sp. MCLR17_036]WIE65942.1 HNH endonuclease signature motif containing protein [Curtobacterium sp. MCLR17_036]